MEHTDRVRIAPRCLCVLGLVILAVAVGGFPAAAQVVVKPSAGGEILGTTVTLDGTTALPGVSIVCLDEQGRSVATVLSDRFGQFRLTGLQAGTYLLRATLAGFRPLSARVTLRAAQVVERRLDLELAGVTETVDVVDRSDAVGVGARMATTLAPKESLSAAVIGQLPIEGGDLQSVLRLVPGVVPGRVGLSIRGGFPGQSTFQLGPPRSAMYHSGKCK